jgi:DNA-binding NarL/FixJ family response regulator
MSEAEARAILRECLRVFELLGEEVGAAACRRALDRLGQPSAGLPEPLTARERQVAELIALGHTNRQIARALGIAPGTASRHVANIMAKLGFHTRAQIARFIAK